MSELQIRFGGALANLYDVGHLTVDLYQLIAFAELLEQKDDVTIQRWYGDKARPFNRYALPLEKYRESSRIRDAKAGSLDLVVSVASLLSSVIVPLVVLYLQNENEAKSLNPGGHFKLPHPWPGQNPPLDGGGRVDDYAVAARLARRSAASFSRQLLPSNFSR